MIVNFIGIDPGNSGGFASIECSDTHEYVDYLPFSQDLYENYKWLRQFQRERSVTKIFIENVHSMPNQGVSSTFKFGKNAGFLEGLAVALDIPYVLVSPQRWQKELKIKPKQKEETKTEFKDRLLKEAKRLYPFLDVWEGTLSSQRAICDAILIAEYGKILENG